MKTEVGGMTDELNLKSTEEISLYYAINDELAGKETDIKSKGVDKLKKFSDLCEGAQRIVMTGSLELADAIANIQGFDAEDAPEQVRHYTSALRGDNGMLEDAERCSFCDAVQQPYNMRKEGIVEKCDSCKRNTFTFNPPRMAKWIMRNYRFIYILEMEELYAYTIEGIWGKYAEGLIKGDLYTVAPKIMTAHKANEVIAAVKALNQIHINRVSTTPVLEDRGNILIKVRNGIFDVGAHALLPDDPDRYFLGRLPITYVAGVMPSKLPQFYWQVSKPHWDRCFSLYEEAAWVFMPKNNFQKSVLRWGAGSNGKDKVNATLRNLVGAENATAANIYQLSENRFSAAGLFGKLVNTGGEIDYSDPLKHTGIIKQLRGESPIRVENKGKPAFDMLWTGKAFFNANKFPKTSDDTVGFYRTWKIDKFENVFSEEEGNIDINLESKLGTENEITGFFNIIVDWFLPLLMKRQGFTFTQTAEEVADTYKRKSDSVRIFIEEMIVPDSQAEISKADMRKAYEGYCQREDLMIESEKGFKQTLNNSGLSYSEPQINKERYWRGIRLKTTAELQKKLADATDDQPEVIPNDPKEFIRFYLKKQGITEDSHNFNSFHSFFSILVNKSVVENLEEYKENPVNPVNPVLTGSEEKLVKPVISESEMTGNAIKPVKPVLITSDHTSTATAGSSSHLPSGSSEASPQGQDHSPNGDGAGSPQEASPPGQPTNNGKPPDDFKAAEAMHKKAVDWWKVQPNRTGDYRGFLKTLSDSESTYGVRCINYMHRVAGELMETESNIFKLVREVLYEPPADDVDPEAYGFPQ